MADFYFAGANTGRGYTHFLEALRPLGGEGRILAVRGAEGTGRDRLLQRAAALWEAQGRAVDCYVDAGDGERLQAVVCGGWAVLDGAPPCRVDTQPGDVTVDLDAALDPNMLEAARDEAVALHRRADGLRRRAWRCLQVADTAWQDSAAILAAAADPGAVMNLRMEIARFLDGAEGPRRRVFARAVTPQGVLLRADALSRPETLCLDLPWGFDPDPLLYPAAVALHARGAFCVAGMQMLRGDSLETLCTDRRAVTCGQIPGCETRALPLDPHVLQRERGALAFNRAAYDLWLRQAVEALAEAKACRERLARLTADALIADKWEALAEGALSPLKNC